MIRVVEYYLYLHFFIYPILILTVDVGTYINQHLAELYLAGSLSICLSVHPGKVKLLVRAED